MHYLTTDQVEELQVELTNVCNAACPMCARNNQGFGILEGMTLTDWQDGDAELAFNLPNLKRVYFCGTHGEPLASSQLLNAVKVCKDKGIVVEIFTNGSLKTEEYWIELLGILTNKDKIVFGIDGIETHHLYRQNTNIEKILRHLELSCKSNVRTQWDFLVFEHNEHELEKCKELSLKLGVNNFRIKKTARFVNDSFPVRNNIGEITHYLKPPKNPEFVHPDYKVMQVIYRKLPDTYTIECIYRQRKEMYINSRMQVFPCCYISDNNENSHLNLDKTQLHVPVDRLNLRDNSWDDILNSSFYKDEMVDSFTNTNVLHRCIRTCGVVKRESNQSFTVFDK